MKKITGFLLAVAFVFAVGFISADNTYAAGDKDNGIKVMVNGQYIMQSKALGYAQVIDDRVMVPYRSLLHALGAKDGDIKYDAKSKAVNAVIGDKTVGFGVGGDDVYIKDAKGNTKKEEMDVPAFADRRVNRTYVSARFISEAFGYNVGWSGEYKTVTILDIDKVLPQLGNPDKDFSLLVKAANISSIRDAGKAYESTGDFTINGLFNNFADPIPVEKDGKKVGKLKINGTGNVVSRVKGTDMTGEFTAKIKFEQTDVNEKSPDAEIMKEMKKYFDLFSDVKFEYKFDVKTGIMYIHSETLDKFFNMMANDFGDTQKVENNNTWYKINISDMYSEQGVDYQNLMLNTMNGTNLTAKDFIKLVMTGGSEEEMIPMTIAELKEVYNAVKAVMGDSSFKVSEEGGNKVYTLDIDQESIIKNFVKQGSINNVDIAKLKKSLAKAPEINGKVKFIESNSGQGISTNFNLKIVDKEKSTFKMNFEGSKTMQKGDLDFDNDMAKFNMKFSSNMKEYAGTLDMKIPQGAKVVDLDKPDSNE